MFISIIPKSHCRIIERFGQPVKVQRSGLAFRIPLLDKVGLIPINWGTVANDGNNLIQLTEQITAEQPRECITHDNAKVNVSSILRWRVMEPIKAVYEVDDLLASLKNAVLNTLRAEIGKMPLDNVFSAREALTEMIVANLAETTHRWGVQVISLEIQELNTDTATSSAMLQQMEAERRSRAIVSEAEGSAIATVNKAKAEKEAAILKAEAEKEAAILKAEAMQEALAIAAEAEKEYLDRLATSVGSAAAVQLLMASKVLEGYKVISSQQGDKIYIPNSINGIVNFDDAVAK